MTKDKNIFIQNIYYMLAYAFRYFRLNMFENIKGEKFEDMQDLFAEILIQSVSSQIKQGLYRTYVSQEGAIPVIRGRIDLLKTHRIQMEMPLNAYCHYDELSFNNPYNQLVKTTLQHLLQCSNIDSNRKKTIKHLLRYFVSIDSMSLASVKWSQFVFDGNNQNYQFLTNVCRFIHEEKIMTTEEGEYKFRALSDNRMERLFEKFVLEYYRRHHPETKPRATQIKWNIPKEDAANSILPIMQTDVMLTIGDRTLIIDAKYYSQIMHNNYDKEELHTKHLYQINAYITNYDVKHTGKVDGMLLYAKTQDGPSLNKPEQLCDGNVIYFKTLDLNRNFKEIAAQLDAIIKQ